MYEQGYDLRHLATMATCKLVIDLVLNIYIYLTFPNGVDVNTPLFEKEYLREKKGRKGNCSVLLIPLL